MLPDRLLSVEDISVVHSHNLHRNHGVGIAQSLIELISQRHLPHLNTVHDIGPKSTDEPEIARTLKRCFCVATSKFNAELLLKRYGINALIIPPTIRFDDFKTTNVPAERTIAYPARLRPSKGHLYVITIMGMLTESIGEITITFSDPSRPSFGQRPDYLQLIENAVARFAKLNYSFARENSASSEIYRRSQVTLAIPLAVEGFGLVPLESLASKRPVITIPQGGMDWLQGVSGAVCLPDHNPIKLAECATEMFSNWEVWHGKVCESFDKLKQLYDVSIIAKQHIDLYKLLI